MSKEKLQDEYQSNRNRPDRNAKQQRTIKQAYLITNSQLKL